MATLKQTVGIFNETAQYNFGVQNVDISQEADGKQSGTWIVGTAEESKTIDADVGTGGVSIFINRDTTDTIEVGWATGDYFTAPIPPGASITVFIPSGTTAVYAKASANTPSLDFELYKA